jgi:uncharacterized protein
MRDYFSLIAKYYPVGTKGYKILVVHAVLVTNKALGIARRLGLGREEQEFIEEAAMVHDIGVVKVASEKMGSEGELPYIAHGVAGAEILRKEGWERHALVAERHVGVGLRREEIEARALPLPPRDLIPVTREEKIITYADAFFSKREETLWQEEGVEEIKAELREYGAEQVAIFEGWEREFGEGVIIGDNAN